MRKGTVQIYSGEGIGKSSAAIGRAIEMAECGKNVVVIRFLKSAGGSDILKRLEPEIKVFRFEKSESDFVNLTEEQKQEEVRNIMNGLNFARKVLSTGECDLLVLDELLGIIDNGIIGVDELKEILSVRGENQSVIMTGIQLCDDICTLADDIFRIETVKFKIFPEE